MSEHTHQPEQLSNPQQAEEIFKQVAELTATRGTQYRSSSDFGEVTVPFPAEVAEHLPQVEDDSVSARRTLYVTQMLDHDTGQPCRTGIVANVEFHQKEMRDEDLGYRTTVNYQVVSDEGETYRLERHVTSGEFGKAAAVRLAGRLAFIRKAAREQNPAEAKDMLNRFNETRKLEGAMGLNDVTALEAQHISDTLASLLQNE